MNFNTASVDGLPLIWLQNWCFFSQRKENLGLSVRTATQAEFFFFSVRTHQGRKVDKEISGSYSGGADKGSKVGVLLHAPFVIQRLSRHV